MRPSATEEIAIVGMQPREARELSLAAEAVGLAVRPLAFGSPLADAALAVHGPGSVRLPLAIVGGCYSLQRPAFGAVLECVEVLRGTRHTLPAACVVLASTADRDGDDLRIVDRQSAVNCRAGRARQSAVNQLGRLDLYRCDIPRRVRQSGRLAHDQHLLYQHRAQHLGGGRI